MTRPVPRPAGTPSFAAALLALVVATTLGTVLAGCGKKGDPLPPIRQIPAATKDLQAVQRGDRLLLSLPYPRTTAAGTPLSAVSEVTIWRLLWDAPATTDDSLPAIDERQFIAAARPERMLSASDLQAAVRGDRIAVEIPVPSPEAATPPEEPEADEAPGITEQHLVTIAAKAQGPTGEESGLSNLVTFVVTPAPEPPTGLEVEGQDRGVRVRWQYPDEPEDATATVAENKTETETETSADQDSEADLEADQTSQVGQAPRAETVKDAAAEDGEDASDDSGDSDDGGGILGFNVYRRLATEREYGEPVHTVGRRSRGMVDESALFGQRYIYTVTAVSQRSPVLVESRFGAEAEIDYRDRFAPAAPTGVVALVQQASGAGSDALQVRVVWRPVAASDVAGYRVYRRSPASQEFQRLDGELVTETALVDPDVTSGASYTYRVTAVDRNDNESEPSEQVTARVR